MTVLIINDCRDENATGRQAARASVLLHAATSFVGIANDFGAAGNLVDALDALEGRHGVVLVNVAPRYGEARQWENGAPFGYFWYRDTLVISTIGGRTLSLVKKLGIVPTVTLLDVPIVLDRIVRGGSHSRSLKTRIAQSQFRSYDFLPLIARYLLRRKHVPGSTFSLEAVPDVGRVVWWVDNFGNCKTTALIEEIAPAPTHTNKRTSTIPTIVGRLPFFPRLKDVPDRSAALVVGSSGLAEKRFLEIVIQGGSAAEYFHLRSGATILP